MLLQLTGVHLSCLYSKNISYFKLILIPSMLLTIILSLFDMADLDDEKANIFNMIRSILNKYCIIKRGVFSVNVTEKIQKITNFRLSVFHNVCSAGVFGVLTWLFILKCRDLVNEICLQGYKIQDINYFN